MAFQGHNLSLEANILLVHFFDRTQGGDGPVSTL
jgi:hypothetical protein